MRGAAAFVTRLHETAGKMWPRTVLALSLLAITQTLAELDSNGTEMTPRECCPCPAANEPSLALTPDPAPPGFPAGANPSFPGLCHCPCLPRDADSEGASSVFFPNAVRAFGNVVRPEPKGDAKPLLNPEVNLASSMLETLREATDEEYRDALERDAARSAAPDTVTLADVMPGEATNVVTIIVSPQDMDGGDDIMAQASHVQETRCIHPPLGNARPSFHYQPQVAHKGLDDILNLPLPSGVIHKQRDNNLAASNVHESVVKVDTPLNNLLSGFRLKTRPGSFRAKGPVKIDKNRNDVENNFNDGSNADDTNAILAKESNSKDFDNHCLNNKDALDITEPKLDSDPFPSDTRNLFVKATEPQESSSENAAVLPQLKTPNLYHLKNLKKLKDVELLPLDMHKIILTSKLNIPNFKFLNKARESTDNPIKLTKLFELLSNPSRRSYKNNEAINDRSTNVQNTDSVAQVQIVPKNKNVTTEILDALPSPSESTNFVSSRNNCLTTQPEGAEREFNEDKKIAIDSISDESIESAEPEIVDISTSVNKNDFVIADLDQFNDATELKRNEEAKINESDSIEKNVDGIIDKQELDQGSTNEIDKSQEEINEIFSSENPSEIEGTEERNNQNLTKDNHVKTFEDVKKTLIQKLDALQLKNRNALNNIKHNVEEITDGGEISLVRQLMNSKAVTDSTSFADETTDELADMSSSAEVSYKDLQNMSNSILKKSEKNKNGEEKNITSKEQEMETIPKSESAEESKEEKFNSEETIESKMDKVLEMDKAGKSTNIGKEDSNASCLIKTSNTKNTKIIASSTTENASNDLETMASEPVMNSILRPNSKSLIDHLSDFESRLRQNIVQPAPLINTDDLNIFNMPALSIPDISELSTNIPTLEEIRARVSDILGGLARHSVDEEVSSEQDSDDFATNINPVLSTGGRNSDSTLSEKQPLKDINLNIIQLKPLPLIPGRDNLKAELPGLNLNTYKAKLAIPNSLHIKPLNLASTLGNDGGLVGATLSIGPENINFGNINSKSKFKPALRTPEPSSFDNFPTIADITSSVQNNAHHLLNIPKTVRGPNLQANNNLKDITDNLKHHTQNTIEHIQQSLNYPSFDDIHTKIKENTHHLLSSGRNTLESLQASAPISTVVDNLKAQTENTMTHLQHPLDSPFMSGMGTNIQRNLMNLNQPLTSRNNLLRNNINVPTINGIADDLRSHAENAVKNIENTLNTPNLPDILRSPMTNTRADYLRSTLPASIPLDTVVDNLRSQSQNTMKHIQKSLQSPTLINLSATAQKHRQDLINPVAITGRDAFGHVLQATAPKDLKPHAEKAVKDLQKTLKATLQNSPIKKLQPITNPNQVLQMISNHQEDVNDKVFAIYTDLNDRLESMHNDIRDPERIKSILSPPDKRYFELFSIPLPNSRMASAKSSVPPVLKTKQPSLGTQRKEFRKSKVAKVSKPKSTSSKLSTMRASTGNARNSPKLSKLEPAGSASTLTRTDLSVLPISKPKLSKPQDSQLLKNLGLQGVKKTLLPKYNQPNDNKVKTFVPTTIRPKLPVASTKRVTPTAKPKISNNKRFKPKPLVRQQTPWSTWGGSRTTPKLTKAGDSRTSPTIAISKTAAPLKSKSALPINKSIKTLSHFDALSSKFQPLPLLKQQPMKLEPISQGRASAPESKLLSASNKPNSSLLDKLTEALKSRPSKANLTLSPDKSSTHLGMAPAASQRVDEVVALEEPMKENVSYKCKMMCVRTD